MLICLVVRVSYHQNTMFYLIQQWSIEMSKRGMFFDTPSSRANMAKSDMVYTSGYRFVFFLKDAPTDGHEKKTPGG